LARKHPRISLAEGAALSVTGLGIGIIAWLAALDPSLRLLIRILLLLFTWFTLWFFSHDLTHHIIGNTLGVRFKYYFLGRSAITKLKLPLISRVLQHVPVLILKIDKASLAKVSVASRRWMHLSGAISSMVLPLLVLPTSYSLGPGVGVLFTFLVVGNVLFTLYFSSKSGDLYRARTGGLSLEAGKSAGQSAIYVPGAK
jgi:hypothetical protein